MICKPTYHEFEFMI